MQHSTKLVKTTTNKQRRTFSKRTNSTDSFFYERRNSNEHNLTAQEAELEAQQAFHEAQARTKSKATN